MIPIERRVLRDRLRELVEDGENISRRIALADDAGREDIVRLEFSRAADLLPDVIAAMREAAREMERPHA